MLLDAGLEWVETREERRELENWRQRRRRERDWVGRRIGGRGEEVGTVEQVTDRFLSSDLCQLGLSSTVTVDSRSEYSDLAGLSSAILLKLLTLAEGLMGLPLTALSPLTLPLTLTFPRGPQTAELRRES